MRVELKWDMPLSYGAPVMQYYILRRRIRKGAIGDGVALNEFPWGHTRCVNVEGNLRDGRDLTVTDLKPGNVYQCVMCVHCVSVCACEPASGRTVSRDAGSNRELQ